jgi:hypothetical protein
MNMLRATLICACLSLAGAHAQAQQGPAKKDPVPKEAPNEAPKGTPKDTLQKEPPGIFCSTSDRARHSDVKKDRTPKAAMPSKDGGADCLDNVVVPRLPMA